MSELLNSGKVGLTVFRNLREQRMKIMDNWADSGLLENLSGFKKANIAQLMENQAQCMLNEVTLDSSAGRFDTVAFPIVRRVFSRLLANELVSVQPLALPSGLLFYMDARVSYNGADSTEENPVYPNYPYAGTNYTNSPAAAAANAPTYSKVAPQNQADNQPGPTFASTTAYERFYNNRGFDLSFGTGYTVIGTTFTLGNTSFSAATSGFAGGIFATQISLGTGFDTSIQQSSATLRLSASTSIYYSAGTSGNILLYTPGNDGWPGVLFYSQQQVWGQDEFASGLMNIILDLRAPGVYGTTFNPAMINDGTNFGGNITTTFTPTYEIFSNIEAQTAMGEITIRFSSVTVNTATRKLRAHWTPELAQDLEAYHSIDAEAELTALLSEHIAAEIDREIIIDIINQAPFRARWDYKGRFNEYYS